MNSTPDTRGPLEFNLEALRQWRDPEITTDMVLSADSRLDEPLLLEIRNLFIAVARFTRTQTRDSDDRRKQLHFLRQNFTFLEQAEKLPIVNIKDYLEDGKIISFEQFMEKGDFDEEIAINLAQLVKEAIRTLRLKMQLALEMQEVAA